MGARWSQVWRVTGSRARILMLGLDGAGKTTILYKLRLGGMVKARPTVGFNMETVEHNHLKLKVFDFGGRSKIRRFWHHYSPDADGVIFVVDSTDGERMGEAKEELQAMMGKRELERAVVLVLANKQDWPKFPCLSHVVPMPPKQSSCNCWGVGHARRQHSARGHGFKSS